VGKPWEIVVGDVRRVLREIPSDSFSACLSDPPYALKFMGAKWDYALPSVNVWAELLRVLKPGAHAMMFGGSRTFHRLAVNVEDAGFFIRDVCMWLYGEAMPKSLDIAKAIDKAHGEWRGRATHVESKNAAMGGPNYGRTAKGRALHEDAQWWEGYGTNLKPGYEPILLACKARAGSFVENALQYGCGALAIDASRVGVGGRWPMNVQLSHSEECVQRGIREVKGTVPTGPRRTGPSDSVARGHMAGGVINSRGAGVEEVEDWECAPGCPVRILDEQAGDRPGMSGGGKHRAGYAGGMFGGIDSTSTARGDRGGPSRFFYTSKASRKERDRGLEGTTVAQGFGVGALRDGGRGKEVLNDHQCIKPIDLCRYYARLLLPPPLKDGKPRRIVVPYSGSGSEILGCLLAGWEEVVGIELDPKHAEKARLRISKGFSWHAEKHTKK
jgi:site-specific DNA-methyltransferase (adenine-specific)